MYNIIYFHGLDSSLSPEKRIILEQFGNVTAPTFNYRNPTVLSNIIEMFEDIKMENRVLVGSSFGGYLSNLFSLYLDIPCLLFNPALAFRSFDLDITKPENLFIQSLSYIVLGRNDEIISADANQNFIEENFKGPTKIIMEENMGHRIPVKEFQKHTKLFFQEMNKYATEYS